MWVDILISVINTNQCRVPYCMELYPWLSGSREGQDLERSFPFLLMCLVLHDVRILFVDKEKGPRKEATTYVQSEPNHQWTLGF